ncbi:hypothetical protein KY361_03615 [Candidatus Woesearchaeota archaeon]|nr:hypothetical protein [Candidatus Woesearchaeota archaeon]
MLSKKIPERVIKKYLEKKEKKPVRILVYEKLGSGWHGVGYKIIYMVDRALKTVILRVERPVGFSHDYPSDRAKVFILQHALSGLIPNHIRSIDVVGLSKNKIVSIGGCKDFYQFVEEAQGTYYKEDLDKLLKKGHLGTIDRKKALFLSNYLVDLHKKKFKGPEDMAKSIHRRHTRDVIGNGEMLIGVLDTYPGRVDWLSKEDITDLIKRAVAFREKIKDKHNRLCRMHGDFHPANIIFRNSNKLKVLDASRELWGEPADDITSLGINYIWYALMHKGNFSGPFKELFEIFWDTYISKTKDYGVNKIAPLFFAFRGVVVAHPTFYKGQSDNTRSKIFNFINAVLDEEEFDYKKINHYLR